MIRTIAGRQNDSVKLARKLQKKKYRREHGLYLVEGMDLIDVAARVEEEPVELLVRDDLVERLPAAFLGLAREDELDVGVCDADTLQHASSLGGAADVIGLFEAPSWSLGDVDLAGTTVFLFGVGDPGNVGAIVRSAVAFGAAGVVASPGTADPYGPKAVRAAMGAQFLTRIVVEVAPEDLLAKLEADAGRGRPLPALVAADPAGDVDSHALGGLVGEEEGVVLVMGSERGELPALGEALRRVAIRQVAFDSLNVGMAATILLYELASRGRPDAAPGEG